MATQSRILGQRLAKKVAWITGGGSGIGRETCMLFANHGAKVMVVDINEESAKETCSIIKHNFIEDNNNKLHIEYMKCNVYKQYCNFSIRIHIIFSIVFLTYLNYILWYAMICILWYKFVIINNIIIVIIIITII